MTEVQIIAVQNPAGRGHEHVRVFGYRTSDLLWRVIEVAITIADATEIITVTTTEKQFPLIEVDEKYIVGCLNTGDIEMIHLKEQS